MVLRSYPDETHSQIRRAGPLVAAGSWTRTPDPVPNWLVKLKAARILSSSVLPSLASACLATLLTVLFPLADLRVASKLGFVITVLCGAG